MRRRRRAYVVDGAPCDEASIASARARGGTSSDGGFEVEFGDETSSGGAWGASSIGGACEATTRIDSAIAGTEDVDGALALRYTIDANFSAAIEARVVREEGVRTRGRYIWDRCARTRTRTRTRSDGFVA